MWNRALLAYFDVIHRHFPGGTEGNKRSVSIVCLCAEICSQNLLNTMQQCHPFHRDALYGSELWTTIYNNKLCQHCSILLRNKHAYAKETKFRITPHVCFVRIVSKKLRAAT
jgi:hypothetical protein